jgi:hypothetical protein
MQQLQIIIILTITIVMLLLLLLLLLLSLFFSSKTSVAEHATTSDSLLFGFHATLGISFASPTQIRSKSAQSLATLANEGDNTIGDSSKALGASGGALGRTRVFIFTAASLGHTQYCVLFSLF